MPAAISSRSPHRAQKLPARAATVGERQRLSSASLTTEKKSDMTSQIEHPPFGRAAKMRFLQAFNKVLDRLEEARADGDPDRIRLLEAEAKDLEWKLRKAGNPDPDAVAASHERAARFMGPPRHAT